MTAASGPKPGSKGGTSGRLVAMFVIGVSLGGLAFLRGTVHADKHMKKHISHSADGRHHGSHRIDDLHRHLGFHHPERFAADGDTDGASPYHHKKRTNKTAAFRGGSNTTAGIRGNDSSASISHSQVSDSSSSSKASSGGESSPSEVDSPAFQKGSVAAHSARATDSAPDDKKKAQPRGGRAHDKARAAPPARKSGHPTKQDQEEKSDAAAAEGAAEEEDEDVVMERLGAEEEEEEDGEVVTEEEAEEEDDGTLSDAEKAFKKLKAVHAGMQKKREMIDEVEGDHGDGLHELDEIREDAEEAEHGVSEEELSPEELKRKKHNERKAKRQMDAAASALTIAEAKVASITSHLRKEKGSGVKIVNGQYKLTGSGALGDKAARLKAAEMIQATKVSTKAELRDVTLRLEREGMLVPGYGFKSDSEKTMGPSDTGAVEDDDSGCKGGCGRMGFCREGACVCVSLYRGPKCDEPAAMPGKMKSAFEGSFIFNRNRLSELPDLTIRYVTNPKAGGGGTHSLAIPVTEDMIRLTPPVDPLGERRYGRCSVIGSSGVMNHYEFGKTIDSSDMVIRFNLAPTGDAYAAKVGRKTTFRFVNTVHAGFREGTEIGIMQMQSQVGMQLYLKFRREHPKERILAFDTDFSKFVSSNVKTLPTGGYFAVWLAMSRCAEVDLYGFNFASGFGVPHHYFNAEKPRKGDAAIHDYKLEHKLIVALAGAGFVRFSEPCVAGCPKKTGIKYHNLAPGSTCQCDTGNPLPVALPGFCRHPGSFMCFVKCPGGADQCPGGVDLKADKHSPADGLEGDCPTAVLEMEENGEAFEDSQGKPVKHQCATWEDVKQD